MSELKAQIDAARKEVERLEQLSASLTCAETGHKWVFSGGKGCGCPDVIDCCSLAVHTCSVCGECDYGENEDAKNTVSDCSKVLRDASDLVINAN